MNKMITAEAIRRYGEASNDLAALHFDAEAAKAAGYTRPIAHGMYIMGIAHSMYLSKHPTRWFKSAQMTFRRPLFSDMLVQVEFDSVNEEVQVTVVGDNGEIIADGFFLVGEI